MQNNSKRSIQKLDSQNVPAIARGQAVWIPEGYELVTTPPGSARESHLWDYIWLIWRNRRSVIFFLFLSMLAAACVILFSTPVYQGLAKLQISSQSLKMFGNGEMEGPNLSERMDYISTQMELLKSRPLARAVVLKYNLYPPDKEEKSHIPPFLQPVFATLADYKKTVYDFYSKQWNTLFPTVPGASSSQVKEKSPDKIMADRIDRFLGAVSLSRIRDTEVLDVKFSDADPALCATVTNGICEEFTRVYYQSKTQSYEYASKMIEEKLAEVKANLQKSEEALYEFGGKQDALPLVENLEKSSSNLDAMRQAIAASEKEMHDREFQLESLKGRKIDDIGARNTVTGRSTLDELRSELQKVEVEYDKTAQQFGSSMGQVKMLRAAKERLESQITAESKRVMQQAQHAYDEAKNQVDYLKQNFAKEPGRIINLQQKMIKYNILKREVDVNKELFNNLLQRSREIGVTAGLKASGVMVIAPAETPMLPLFPKKNLIVMIAGFIGLITGCGFVFFRQYMDTTIQGITDIESEGKMTPLGFLPHIRTGYYGNNGHGIPEMITANAPHSSFAENMRDIRTSLRYSKAGQAPQTILVTSAMASEGKTVVAANLAIALAQGGYQTILVDADMKTPSLHRFFPVGKECGLSDILTGNNNGEMDYFHLGTNIPNLHVLPSGPAAPNPVDLLDSYSMKQLMSRLTEQYDYVILDSSAGSQFATTSVLVNQVDAVILVAKSRKTPRASLSRLYDKIRNLGGNVAGVILNDREERKSRKRFGEDYQCQRSKAASHA